MCRNANHTDLAWNVWKSQRFCSSSRQNRSAGLSARWILAIQFNSCSFLSSVVCLQPESLEWSCFSLVSGRPSLAAYALWLDGSQSRSPRLDLEFTNLTRRARTQCAAAERIRAWLLFNCVLGVCRCNGMDARRGNKAALSRPAAADALLEIFKFKLKISGFTAAGRATRFAILSGLYKFDH